MSDPKGHTILVLIGIAIGALGVGANLATLSMLAAPRPSADLPDGAWQRTGPAQPRTAAPPNAAPVFLSSPATGTRAALDEDAPDRSILRGTASWYAASGRIAAAGPALRRALGKGWRGTSVIVTAGGRSVAVRLTDWCRCPRAVIDLSDDAFARLAPLSVGVLRVRVTVPGLPETSR